jgi:hypothetical protein
VPLAAMLLIQLVTAGSSFGVASVPAAGEACVAMPEPQPVSGSTVTLVEPARPQSVLTASVEQPVASCDQLERGMVSGPYYRLERFSGKPEPGTVWVAFRGALASRSLRSGGVALRLDSRYRNIQVRSCTSQEGVHLTVWAGQPLRSRRLWHQYYYLGFDVTPSCDDADTRGTAN